MCEHFFTNEMYVAVDKDTNTILIGGGSDKRLPFARLNPENAPTKIRVKGKLYDVDYLPCEIMVTVLETPPLTDRKIASGSHETANLKS